MSDDIKISRLESRLEIITYFSQSIYRRNSIDGVLWDIVSNCINRLGFVDCVIYLLDKSTNRLVQKAAYGGKNLNDESVLDPIEIPLGEGIVGSVAKTGKAEIISDTRMDPRYILDDNFRLSELTVPIISDGSVIGIIDSEHPETNFYDQYHLDVIQDIALISATKIERTWNEEERQDLLLMHLENPSPIVRVSRQHQVLLHNKAAANILTDVKPFTPIEQRKRLFDAIDESLERDSRKLVTVETNEKVYRTEIVPVKRLNYVNLYFVDVTKIHESKVIAEKANREKTEFMSAMSHEIRTPLNGIINLNRLLKDQIENQQQQKYLEAIEYSGNNLLSIINDILDFEKLGSGKLTFTESGFRLQNTIEKIVNLLAPRATEKNLSLTYQIQPHTSEWLIADENRLAQVITNIVNNALKFTHKGTVELLVSDATTESGLTALKILVKDTGIGIPQQKLNSIFDSYEQVTSNEHTVVEGTGLGLAISKRIVEQLDGHISVESQVNAGSIFTIVYPVTFSDSLQEADSASTPSIDSIKNRRILIVDDSPINILAAKEYLHAWGAEVCSAENGLEAIEKCKTNNLDLVLMDLQMPVMDGYTALSKIRQLGPKYNQLPIIAMSADVLNISAQSAHAAGFSGQMSKPFEPDELLRLISHHIECKIPNTTPT